MCRLLMCSRLFWSRMGCASCWLILSVWARKYRCRMLGKWRSLRNIQSPLWMYWTFFISSIFGILHDFLELKTNLFNPFSLTMKGIVWLFIGGSFFWPSHSWKDLWYPRGPYYSWPQYWLSSFIKQNRIMNVKIIYYSH